MSVKMYEAYRIPRGRIDEFILLFNRICIDNVRDRVTGFSPSKGFLKETKTKLFGRKRNVLKQYSDSDICLISALAQGILMSQMGRNDRLHLDCCFNLWMRGRYAYIQPLVMTGISLEKELPYWCEFYGYWNNVDPQEGVSESSWAARGRIWDELALDDWDRIRMSHITLEMKMPFLNGLKTLLKSVNPDEEWMSNISMATTCLFYKLDEEREAKRLERKDLGG